MDNNIKQKLIEGALKKYSMFEFSEEIIEKILLNLEQTYEFDKSIDIYYAYYFRLNEEIELYILDEMRKGNVMYQLYFWDLKKYIVKRYFTLRPDKLEFFNNKISYRNREEYEIKLNKYCEKICDDIIDEMLSESNPVNINKTIIKKISKNLTNDYFNI